MDTQATTDATSEKAPWVSKARNASTYRASRRNAAKKVRAWKGGTINELTAHAPFQKNNYTAMQPVYYQKFSKTSAKVYRGGNVPGSVRRFKERFFPTQAPPA